MGGQVTMVLSMDESRVVMSHRKLGNSTDLLIAKTKKLMGAQNAYTKASVRGNKRHTSSISPIIKQYFGMQAALGLATKGYASLERAQKRAADSAKETDFGMGSLAQLAKNTAELRRMVSEARKSMREQGMTREQAGGLQFALESSGKGSERRLFSSLQGIADPRQMLEAVNTLQGAMTRKETGSSIQVLDKLFKASSVTKTNVTDLAMSAAAAGKPVKQIGGSDEELLATLAVLTRGDVSADIVSTQIQGLAAAAAKSKRIKTGGGIIDIVKQIQAKNLSERGLYKLLGRRQAVKGFLGISQTLGDIEKEKADLEGVDQAAAAGTGSFTTGRIAAYQEVFAPQRSARVAGARASLAEERVGGKRALTRETGKKFLDEQLSERGYSAITRDLSGYAFDIATRVGFSPESVLDLASGKPGRAFGLPESPLSGIIGGSRAPDLSADFEKEMGSLTKSIQELNATFREDKHAKATDGRN